MFQAGSVRPTTPGQQAMSAMALKDARCGVLPARGPPRMALAKCVPDGLVHPSSTFLVGGPESPETVLDSSLATRHLASMRPVVWPLAGVEQPLLTRAGADSYSQPTCGVALFGLRQGRLHNAALAPALAYSAGAMPEPRAGAPSLGRSARGGLSPRCAVQGGPRAPRLESGSAGQSKAPPLSARGTA